MTILYVSLIFSDLVKEKKFLKWISKNILFNNAPFKLRKSYVHSEIVNYFAIGIRSNFILTLISISFIFKVVIDIEIKLLERSLKDKFDVSFDEI